MPTKYFAKALQLAFADTGTTVENFCEKTNLNLEYTKKFADGRAIPSKQILHLCCVVFPRHAQLLQDGFTKDTEGYREN